MTERSVREWRREDGDQAKPLHAVWELTMRCDQACAHCGSRALRPRPDELSTEEVLAVGDQLAALGCREVALVGGEAYLRPDIVAIVQHLSGLGMRTVMQTGGRTFGPERARQLRQAGLVGLGVSVDGPAEAHDRLRANRGSHAAALAALDAGREAGLLVTANTQINRLNQHALPETFGLLKARGIRAWQVQLTVPMGRAADRPEWIVEPRSVVDIIDTLAQLQLEDLRQTQREGQPRRDAVDIVCGNNLGYFGPHEVVMRSRVGGVAENWGGCGAGFCTLGIESDGTIKGCPSLPTAPYAGGNIRELSLEDIWLHSERIAFARSNRKDELWGHCRSCYYADICQGGCSWMAHCSMGKRGNNPFCYHRVNMLKKEGIRERLVPVEKAPNSPYDFGRFDLVEEPWDSAETKRDLRSLPLLS